MSLYERALATDGSKHFMTTDLANQLISAASAKMTNRNNNLKNWCEENGLDMSEWQKVDSEEKASQLIVTEVALRFSARKGTKRQ